jgi:DNA-binding beta-propeller fold protein YncE
MIIQSAQAGPQKRQRRTLYQHGAQPHDYSGDGGAATSAKLYWPIGVAVNSSSPYLFIADFGNNRIRAVYGF